MERREDEHSPLPWRWLPDEGQFIIDVNGNIVAEVPCQGCNPTDGALIVQAVNQHPTLVEQRDRLLKVLESKTFCPSCDHDYCQLGNELLTAIKAPEQFCS